MKTALSFCMIAVLIAACTPVEDTKPIEAGQPIGLSASDVRTVHAGVRSSMKDPDSARFGSLAAARDSKGTVTVCGYVNGKNSYGGYTGEKPFLGILMDGSKGKAFSVVDIGGTESDVYAITTVCRRAGVNLR